MNRKLSVGVIVFLALSLGLVCGFFAGKREGAKPGQVHKKLAATLRKEQKDLRRDIGELEENNSELEKQLSDARIHSAACQKQFDDFLRIQESESFVGLVFPELALMEVDILIRERITELECEVASLEELLYRDCDTNGVGADSASGSILVKASEIPVGKEQCAAITKKGVRCSRVAKSNGKCWQHGG